MGLVETWSTLIIDAQLRETPPNFFCFNLKSIRASELSLWSVHWGTTPCGHFVQGIVIACT
jgi:hypothetical protein